MNNNIDKLIQLLIILGPTAIGKTGIAVKCAKRYGGEIISADSRQVYRRLDIGTGKDLSSYDNIPVHLINVCKPGERFSLKQFQYFAMESVEKIFSRLRFPIICGGTGLYISSIVERYEIPAVKPDFALRDNLENMDIDKLIEVAKKNKIVLEPGDTKRRIVRKIEMDKFGENSEYPEYSVPQYKIIIIGITATRSVQKKRISDRLEDRLKAGMIEEVEKLLTEGVPEKWLISLGLEYKWIVKYLSGEVDYRNMKRNLRSAIIAFSKRQNSWFRRMERRGSDINWFDVEREEEIYKFLDLKFNKTQ